MKNIKLTRRIPEGYTALHPAFFGREYKPEIGSYPKEMFACYVNLSDPQKPKAMFFTGKQSKTTWSFWFKDIESMKKKINESISRLMSWEDAKFLRKQEKKKEIETIQVGQIFVSSWGYDQTNVDFYQVTEVKGKTFIIREISGKRVEGSGYSHGMADEVTPVRDAFLDEKPMVKRSLKLNSYSWLSKTDDKTPHYHSWYA